MARSVRAVCSRLSSMCRRRGARVDASRAGPGGVGGAGRGPGALQPSGLRSAPLCARRRRGTGREKAVPREDRLWLITVRSLKKMPGKLGRRRAWVSSPVAPRPACGLGSSFHRLRPKENRVWTSFLCVPGTGLKLCVFARYPHNPGGGLSCLFHKKRTF